MRTAAGVLQLPRRKRGYQSDEAKARYHEEVQAFCEAIKAIASRLDFKVSSRGWCYVLENEAGLAKGDFDRAQELINDCRKDGSLPLDICAEDSSREFEGVEAIDTETPAEFAASWLDAVEGAHEDYRPISFWDAQECYVQLFVEKIDLKSLFAGICDEFCIPRANTKGWNEINARAELMRRFAWWEGKGKQCVLLYCGDFDPAGLLISESLRQNLAELSRAVGWSPDNLIIDRFGLNLDFIEGQGLTWIDGLWTGSGKNLADPKHPDHAKAWVQDYLQRYGARKVEANAMVIRPDESRALLRQTILRYVPEVAPLVYQGRLQRAQREAQREIRREMRDRT